jgi:hypothetical protein
MMEIVDKSETSVNFYQTTRSNIFNYRFAHQLGYHLCGSLIMLFHDAWLYRIHCYMKERQNGVNGEFELEQF